MIQDPEHKLFAVDWARETIRAGAESRTQRICLGQLRARV